MVDAEKLAQLDSIIKARDGAGLVGGGLIGGAEEVKVEKSKPVYVEYTTSDGRVVLRTQAQIDAAKALAKRNKEAPKDYEAEIYNPVTKEYEKKKVTKAVFEKNKAMLERYKKLAQYKFKLHQEGKEPLKVFEEKNFLAFERQRQKEQKAIQNNEKAKARRNEKALAALGLKPAEGQTGSGLIGGSRIEDMKAFIASH